MKSPKPLVSLAILFVVAAVATPSLAQISQGVRVCNPSYPTRCVTPAADGSIQVTGTVAPTGTQDINQKQVNGATINVGVGAASTGTQRVATSTDSTIASVGTITNPVAATQSGTWTVQPGNTANTTPWLVTGSGSAGAAAPGVVTVQGVANGTSVTVAGTIGLNTAAGLTTSGPPVRVSASAATSLVLQASPGNYYDGYCFSSAAGNCILYNATSVPSAGALTAYLVLECVPVTAGGRAGWDYNPLYRRASIGAVMLFSSDASCGTYTASSTAYIHATFQ